MKNLRFSLLSLGILTAGVVAFTAPRSGSIKGKITPSDVAGVVWAVSGTDTLKTFVSSGSFEVTAKPGTYKVIIDVADPYKDVVKENVLVADGTATDLGDVKVSK